MTDTPDDLFLLNPQNRDVATGNAPCPKEYLRNLRVYLNWSFLCLLAFILTCGFLFLDGELYKYFRLSSAGVTTPATVVDRRISTSDDSTSYYITYEFRYVQPNGEPAVQRGEDDVSSGEYERLEPGMQIEVISDPNDPSVSALQLPNIFNLVWQAPYLVSLVLPAFVFPPLTVFWIICYIKKRKLARDGQLIYGTITHFRSYTDSDDDFVINMHYQFVTPRGSTFQNEERRVRNDLAGQPLPSVGTPIAIWYADDKTYRIL